MSYATPKSFIINTAIATQNPAVSNATSGVAISYALASGSLPTGLSLDTTTGAITGKPTVSGTYPFSITVTNGTNAAGNSRSSTASVSYTIALATLGYSSPVTYVEKVAITANTPSPLGITPTSYAVTVGTLPAGLAINGTSGAISGTPTTVTAGAVSVTITGTQGGTTAAQVVSITVGPAAPTALGYTTPVTYINGSAITANAPVPTGGTPSSYQVTSGVLPAGLSIDPSTGIISGTPTATVNPATSVTIKGSNGTGYASQTLSITVNGAAPTALNYSTPNTYTNGTPIAPNNPNPTGGTPSSYSVSPALPAGISLNTTSGVISGTPSIGAAAANYTVTGTNGAGSVTKVVSVTVVAAAPTALHYSTPVLYAVGDTVLNEPNPDGGVPTSYAITSGTLPAGLTLNTTTGVISGSPTASLPSPYSVSLVIRGTNTTGNISQTVVITIPPPVVAHFSGNPLSLPVGQSASLSPVYSGGTGNLDQGIGAVNSGAVVNVTSASAGSTAYTLTVTNGYGQSATANVSIAWVNQATQIDLLVPADGGVSSDDVTDNTSPLYGIKVVVPTFPSGSCGSTHLIIYKDANALPTGAALPTGVRACSPTFDLTTTAGYPFRLPITVTLPYSVGTNPTLNSSDVPVPFYWDPTYGKWVACGIKSLDTGNHLVTFTTLLPGLYTVLVMPGLYSAPSSYTTTIPFTNSVDGWFQPNQGVFDVPGGSSFGMSALASWYFGQAKYNATTNASSPYTAGLYSMFRQGVLASDDVSARALISRLANGTLESWTQLYSQSNYALTDLQTGLALITALKVTGQPQLFLMGDARPALSNALSTLVTNFTYASSTYKFKVMDPNYPGTDLSITWSPTGSGSFTAYDRAAGYIPAFVKYAFEGHPSVHRLADYERALSGASTGWLNPPFATINLSQVGDITPVTLDGTTLQVTDASNVTITGTITNGDNTSNAIYWSQNGGTRTAVTLNAGNSFSFSLGALINPFSTRVMLETSPNACDSTFGHTGFQEFWIKDRALIDWFINSCFEKGLLSDNISPIGWTLSQGSNSGVAYNNPMTWDKYGNPTNYPVVWSVSPVDSGVATQGTDPFVSGISKVLDGSSSYRLNNSATGAHISRLTQTVTVPTTVADPSLSFYWAAVLDNPSHPDTDQPFVDIWIQDFTDPNNVTTLYYKHFYSNDPSYPGWLTGSNTWLGIPWQKVSLTDLSALKGHKLKITLLAADCNQTGHGGYIYVDNVACN
ncbi:MAG: hypothetical protein HGB30_01650 [Holophagaceae bacterium]|nr:hypothetical protein [Holophagaceae bacterium]